MRLFTLLPLLLLIPSVAVAQSAPLHGDVGNAYARDGTLLYREQHITWRQDGQTQRVVIYRCPDGAAFARKRLRATADPAAPDFSLLDGAIGQRIEVRRHDGGIALSYRSRRGADTHTAQLPLPRHAIIDAGFNDYVLEHWDSLLGGATRHVAFLLPSRREWMNFSVRRVDKDEAARAGAAVFRLQLGSWFGFMLPHVDVRYSLDDRRLLDYRGPSNLSNARGDNPWVNIEFPADQVQATLSAQALAAAEQAPLDGRCSLH